MSNEAQFPGGMPTPVEDPVKHMLQVLRVRHVESERGQFGHDVFEGENQWMMTGRIFGGQVFAQALITAQRTVPEDRQVHSMHGYFLRPGDIREPIRLEAERIHDGRSFSTRRGLATQNGVPIFSSIASFQTEDGGPESHAPMPEGMPDPESLPSLADMTKMGPPELALSMEHSRAFDVRHVDGPSMAPRNPDALRQGIMHAWIRTLAPLPVDEALHRAVIAYMSDLGPLEPILARHGLHFATPGLKMASLDHTVWWHRPARADEWLLLRMHATSTGGGRGLTHCRVFSQDGRHVASFAQEGMVRIPEGAVA